LRLIGSPFVAEKAVIRERELDIDVRLVVRVQSIGDRLSKLRRNVLVQTSPEKQHWRVQRFGAVE
jgi:hypothetical protein